MEGALGDSVVKNVTLSKKTLMLLLSICLKVDSVKYEIIPNSK
jgi:hypothetical protein